MRTSKLIKLFFLQVVVIITFGVVFQNITFATNESNFSVEASAHVTKGELSEFLVKTYLLNIEDREQLEIYIADKMESGAVDADKKYEWMAEQFSMMKAKDNQQDYISNSDFKRAIKQLYILLRTPIDTEKFDQFFNSSSPEEMLTFETLERIVVEAYTMYPIKVAETDKIVIGFEALIFKENIQELFQASLEKYPLQGQYGISITELKTGYNYRVNGDWTYDDAVTDSTDAYFMAASVIKLPLAIAIIDMVEKGEINLSDYSYDSYIGENLNWDKEIYGLIAYSDNDAFNSAIRLFGRERLNDKFDELGMTNFKVWSEIAPAKKADRKRNYQVYGTTKGGRINPDGMEVALRHVYEGYQESSLMKTLKKAMYDSSFNGHGTRIPRGVSKSEKVLHKTGTVGREGIYGDAGIVYGKNPYTIILMTQNDISEKRFNDFTIDFTRRVNDYFNNSVK